VIGLLAVGLILLAVGRPPPQHRFAPASSSKGKT